MIWLYNDISAYSLINAILLFFISIFVIMLLRNNTIFLIKYSTELLMSTFLMSLIRIILPLEFYATKNIDSKKILPYIIEVWNCNICREITIGKSILILWFVGVIISILHLLKQIWIEWQITRQYQFVQSNQLLRLQKESFLHHAIIRMSPDIGTPQMTGILKPCIYIPVLDLSDNEMRFILKHEMQHFKGHDIYIKLFYSLIKSIFWWNPLISSFQRELSALLELRCDMNVTKDMDEKDKKKYLSAILNVLRQMKEVQKTTLSTTIGLIDFSSPEFLKQRFQVVLNTDKKKYHLKRLSAYVILIGLFVSSYMIVIHPSYSAPKGTDWTEDIPKASEDCLLKINENKYEWIHKDKIVTILSKEQIEEIPYCNFTIYQYEESK